MNFKTTAVLTALLVVLLTWFMIARPDRTTVPMTSPADATAGMPPKQLVYSDMPEIDAVTAITATRSGQAPWRFERTNPEAPADKAEWKMVQPIETKVQKWEMESIARTIKDVSYQIKYASGDAGAVKRADAGLEPSRLDVKLETKDGKSYSFLVGKPASVSTTYVSTGPGDVYVVEQSFENLVKKSADQYRDNSLLQFPAADAVSMTIRHRAEDGVVAEYRLVKHGADWVFESPFAADADDKVVSEAITSAARLRAVEWVESDAKDGLGRFGLGAPRVEVEISTQETPPTPPESDKPEGEEAAPPEPVTTQTKHYGFAVSAAGPLGKEAQVFARLKDGSGVAVITKPIAEKFVPVIEKWRDMRVTPATLTGATRIDWQAGGESGVLVKKESGGWSFEESGATAEQAEIEGLLRTLSDLKALNFVDAANPADAAYGFGAPRAKIVITNPGSEQPETFVLGNPTDEAAKRVYYLRRGESPSIAKIRATDAAVLDRRPGELLNREIFKIVPTDIEKVELSMSATAGKVLVVEGGEAQSQGAKRTVAITQRDNQWRMTQPIDGPVDVAAAARLAAMLANLRAERVASAKGEPGRFGIENPAVRVTVAYKGPGTVTGDANAGPPVAESISVSLDVAERDQKVYARRGDSPVVYELRRTDYEALTADLHDKTVLSFEQSQSSSISVMSGGSTHKFVKRNDAWVYEPEPDLPIDPKKVENLLVQLHDLKLARYADYGVADLARYGLDSPAKVVKVSVEENRTLTLLISAKSDPNDAGKGVYAALEGTRDVFLLSPDAVSRFDIRIADFEKAPGA